MLAWRLLRRLLERLWVFRGLLMMMRGPPPRVLVLMVSLSFPVVARAVLVVPVVWAVTLRLWVIRMRIRLFWTRTAIR